MSSSAVSVEIMNYKFNYHTYHKLVLVYEIVNYAVQAFILFFLNDNK